MKKKLLCVYLVILCCNLFLSQVGIGTTQPNSKSILDIKSTDKGVLIPRMTQNERDAILPGTADLDRDGLLVYNTDTHCYNYWNIDEGKWMTLCQNSSNCDPSSFADYTINCSQFPAADTNTYIIGQNTSATITISVNVTKIGPYAIEITDNANVSYSIVGTFTTTGAQSVTLIGGGTPNFSPITFIIKTNGITSTCTYQKTAATIFNVTYTCGASTPTQSSINFTIGTQATGSFTIPITVTGTGNIPSQSFVSNGITFTTVAITGANSSNTNLTVNYSGTPTASPINFIIGTCNYTFVPSASFSFTYNCSAATVSPQMTRGINRTGTVTVPITVTGSGTIPAFNQTVNGVTYSFSGIAANSSSSSIVINYTGIPNTDSSILTLTGSNSSSCNVNISHPYSNAVYSGCSTQVNGNYYVATALNSSNTIMVTLNVTSAGIIKLASQDKNGIKFESAQVFVNTGSQQVTLNSVASETGIYPMTSEEISQGANGSNNQSSTYIITNTLTSSTVPCNASIDVKPRVWTTSQSIAGVTSLINGPSNQNISLKMQDQASLQSGIGGYFKVWVINNGTSNWTDVSTRTRSYYEDAYLLSWDNGTVTPVSDRLGSLDGYLQAAAVTGRPNFTGENGAHAGPLTLGEVSDNGITFKWTAPATGDFGGLGTKYYKYRVVYFSRSLGLTDQNLVLIGIYDTKPATWVPPTGTTNNSASGGPQRYWP